MKLSQLKEILKETVREVVREEVRNVLREEINPSKKTSFVPSPKPQQFKQKPLHLKSTGDPIQDLLNETAQDGEWRTMANYTANDARSFMSQHNNFMGEPQVTNVESLINNNKHQVGLSHHQISVNEVPDFSNIMDVMKSKGML